MYWQCTYLSFDLLEAPREYVLHGPLWERALEATLVRRRLFIVLMTAAHISPNIFSLWVFLTNIQRTSHYNTWQWHKFILYITFIRTFTSPYYTSHSHIHFLISSVLRGRLAALGFLCPIHLFTRVWIRRNLAVSQKFEAKCLLVCPKPESIRKRNRRWQWKMVTVLFNSILWTRCWPQPRETLLAITTF